MEELIMAGLLSISEPSRRDDEEDKDIFGNASNFLTTASLSNDSSSLAASLATDATKSTKPLIVTNAMSNQQSQIHSIA